MAKIRVSTLIIVLFLVLFTTNKQISSSTHFFNTIESLKSEASKNEPLDIAEILKEYEKWLDNEIELSGTVGAAVAIVYKNQVALIKCYGNKKAGTDDPINEHTVFRLASVSKTVTGVLAGILAQENIINLDEKVTESLPWFKLNDAQSTNQLTIRNLLSHTTGIVPHAYDDLVEHHLPLGNILTRMKDVAVSASPGKLYGYQNVMFSMLDTILSVKTSKNYSQIIKEKLFDPLGMKDASTDFQSFRDNLNIAYPHSGKRPMRLNDRYYTTAPAAGVNASISDMSRFLLALTNDNNPLLDNKYKNVVFSPQIVSPLKRGYFRYWDSVKSKQYAIGWRIVDYRGREVAYHGGFVSGYKAEIALCQQEDVAIIYLTNSPNSVASQSIPEFLNALFEFKNNAPVLAQTKESDESDLKSGS